MRRTVGRTDGRTDTRHCAASDCTDSLLESVWWRVGDSTKSGHQSGDQTERLPLKSRGEKNKLEETFGEKSGPEAKLSPLAREIARHLHKLSNRVKSVKYSVRRLPRKETTAEL